MRKGLKELDMFNLEKRTWSTFQILERLSYRGGAGSVLDHPRVQDMQQWTRSQILVEYQEKLPNC